MKSLSNILRNADLTPTQRVLAYIRHDVEKEQTGKSILSEAEIYTLTKVWRPKNRFEVEEYNKYIKGYKIEGHMRLDAQMFSMRSEADMLRAHILSDQLLICKNDLEIMNSRDVTIKHVNIDDSIKLLTKNTYLSYDKVLHIITFNKLDKEIKKDFLLLDEYISTDKKYFEEQVFLYEVFKKDEMLNKQDKDLLINCIYSCIYYEGLRKIKGGSEKDGFLINHFFGELPVSEILKNWCHRKNIVFNEKSENCEKEILNELEKYCIHKECSLESEIKKTLSDWIDSGLFVTEYTPLYLSNQYNTWNGDTKLNHKDLFDIWYAELQNSRKYLQDLNDVNDIKIDYLDIDTFGNLKQEKVITGESLYLCEQDIDFVKEYKEQVSLLLPIANLYLFIEKYVNPKKIHKTLLHFKELSETLSGIFEVDITAPYLNFIEKYKQDLFMLNYNLEKLIENAQEYLCTKKSLFYITDILEGNLQIGLSDSGDESEELARKYEVEINKTFRL